MLGLLSAIRRVSGDFKNRPKSSEALRVSLCIFIRADIFEIVLEQAREPDKIQHERILGTTLRVFGCLLTVG